MSQDEESGVAHSLFYEGDGGVCCDLLEVGRFHRHGDDTLVAKQDVKTHFGAVSSREPDAGGEAGVGEGEAGLAEVSSEHRADDEGHFEIEFGLN